MPKVSVIIPVYNAERFIKETVESILAQTYQDFEIVVINDGSTDKSAEIIRSFDDKRIIYSYQKNQGLSIARNEAILKSNGEYIALLDQDDLWLPEKIEKQISLLDSSPEIGLVCSDCYVIDSQGKIMDKVFNQCKHSKGMVLPQLFLDNFISCPTAVIRKLALNKVGLFDPDFSIAADYDLWLRIAQFFDIEYTDIPLAKYRIHANNMSCNITLGYKEKIEVIEKCLKRCPAIKDVLKTKVARRLAKSHYSLGRTYQLQRQFSQSRKELLKSIQLYPFNIKAYICWVLSVLGIVLPARRTFFRKEE